MSSLALVDEGTHPGPADRPANSDGAEPANLRPVADLSDVDDSAGFDKTREYFPGCANNVIELAKFEPLHGPWPATVNRSLVDVVASMARLPEVAPSQDDWCDPHGIKRPSLAELPTWGARRHTGRGRLQLINTIRPSDGTSPAATRPAAGEYGRTSS